MRWTGIALLVCCATALSAQDAAQPAVAAPPAEGHGAPTATLHGIVRNAITGSPLPRALVRVYGDSSGGALTDENGHFEIPDVLTGGVQLSVIKPGFFDSNAGPSGSFAGPAAREGVHVVVVAPSMPEVVFALAPLNAIRGQIQFTSGEPAQGIGVTLLKQGVEAGRAMWQVETRTTTNADGVYRFGGLIDGTYIVRTDLAMESELNTTLLESGSAAARIERSGYPSEFYPEGKDVSDASKIRLHGGETMEADMSLTLEPFHAVTARVLFQGGAPPRQMEPGAETPGVSYAPEILDAQGHDLPYVAQYDAENSTVQALLPDGAYTLMVTASAPRILGGRGGTSLAQDPAPLVGAVSFAVAGHAIGNLRVPLAMIRNATMQVDLVHSNKEGAQPSPSDSASQMGVIVSVTETGGANGDLRRTYAEGPVRGPLHTTFTGAGAYWAQTNLQDQSFCEESLMAGGANLAREPLVLGLNGPTEPVTLSLRSDCASLTLNLRSAQTAGEERPYTIYVVPEFDSTVDVMPQTLHAGITTAIELHGLTPGRYRVYTLAGSTALAYRDQNALAALTNPAQEIELAPNAKANLVVEVPEP